MQGCRTDPAARRACALEGVVGGSLRRRLGWPESGATVPLISHQ